MANILDIFRTQTGKKLLERSREITELDVGTVQQAFIFTLPALLTIYEKKEFTFNEQPKDLIKFIENENLVDFGKEKTELLLESSEKKIILDFSQILEINKVNFEMILHISAAVIAIIISEIRENKNAEARDISKTLCGLDTKYNEDFVKVLIKNPDDANIIDSREEIALNKNWDDNDPSILGGYAGGR
ncbi:hypothetical protein [Christiangramia sediminis]|uniref:Uncharacterized protein n=1 Tax=Christiangramia sediminis TaxID=2881336 RepID=A0A9X1RVA6_9FLAO|nr:hypothetical protein [Christiangramia sediminis]MCB7480036.1 hypothetical protein [Christiangramia sediminis]